MNNFELSIVITVQDHDVLRDALPVFAQQTCGVGKFEILICHGSEFNSHQLIKDYQNQLSIKCVETERTNRAFQQNCGIKAATAPLVLLWGDDFIPCKNLVQSHMDFHQEHPEEIHASLGPAIFGECEVNDFMEWADETGRLFGADFRSPESIPKDFFYGANSCVKKSLLLKAGKFDEDFLHDSWDDYELGLRLVDCGMQVSFLPEAIAIHKDPTTLDARCQNYFNAGQNAFIFDQKYPGQWPWQEQLTLSPSSHRFRAKLNQFLYRTIKMKSARTEWYMHTLNAAFVEGYRTAEVNQNAAPRSEPYKAIQRVS